MAADNNEVNVGDRLGNAAFWGVIAGGAVAAGYAIRNGIHRMMNKGATTPYATPFSWKLAGGIGLAAAVIGFLGMDKSQKANETLLSNAIDKASGTNVSDKDAEKIIGDAIDKAQGNMEAESTKHRDQVAQSRAAASQHQSVG